MKSIYPILRNLSLLLPVIVSASCTEPAVRSRLVADQVRQFEKTVLEIEVARQFENPYDQEEVMVDMVITSPSGASLTLPCFFTENEGKGSRWKARFAPKEAGAYGYYFRLETPGTVEVSEAGTFVSEATENDGFLHTGDFWTLRFDSGRPFRGIGENVGWEARDYEDPRYTYDYLLPKLARNGANFFRTWMCSWDLPVWYQRVTHTNRYENSDEYFHPGGIKRMDELVDMADSLGLYIMLAIDYHGALIPGGGWENNRYNALNGGPAKTPLEFFTSAEARAMSKNKLRFLVARWGYSPHIGAWEFFNEIDNAVFTPTPEDSILIPHRYVTDWHREMSEYLKSIDPYDHIVTTSVSHREIDGMFELKNIDIVQKHIYRKTDQIPSLINRYVQKYDKPFVWGEFGYEWDWNLDFSTMADEKNFDYKRGLWYGLFNPTPVLPMSWWWEFFDEQNMTPYFRSVREISDRMMEAGNGKFEKVEVTSGNAETYAVKCGNSYFVYLLSKSPEPVQATAMLTEAEDLGEAFFIQEFDLESRSFTAGKGEKKGAGAVISVKLQPREQRVFILGNDPGNL